jgi:hypothetical protein
MIKPKRRRRRCCLQRTRAGDAEKARRPGAFASMAEDWQSVMSCSPVRNVGTDTVT